MTSFHSQVYGQDSRIF